MRAPHTHLESARLIDWETLDLSIYAWSVPSFHELLYSPFLSLCIHCQFPSSLSPAVSCAVLFFIFPYVFSFLLVTCTGVPFSLWYGHASEVYIDYRVLIYTSVDNEENGRSEKDEYSGPQSLFRNFHLIVERLNRNWFCNLIAHSVRS